MRQKGSQLSGIKAKFLLLRWRSNLKTSKIKSMNLYSQQTRASHLTNKKPMAGKRASRLRKVRQSSEGIVSSGLMELSKEVETRLEKTLESLCLHSKSLLRWKLRNIKIPTHLCCQSISTSQLLSSANSWLSSKGYWGKPVACKESQPSSQGWKTKFPFSSRRKQSLPSLRSLHRHGWVAKSWAPRTSSRPSSTEIGS